MSKGSKSPKREKQKTQFYTPPPKIRPEPTDEQLGRIDDAEVQVEINTAEYGPPNELKVPEKRSVTLEESLKRVEKLLTEAGGFFEKAKEREAEATGKLDEISHKERELAKRESKCQADEDLHLEHASRLAEREINAEQGFRAERARVLKPLEDEVERLRADRDRLEAEARAKTMEWADKWMQQENERSVLEEEERRSFIKSMADERQQQLTNLRNELMDERLKLESVWKMEFDARCASLDARTAELNDLEKKLADNSRELHRSMLDIQLEKSLLAEDKEALDRKIDRLVAEHTENLRHETDSLRKQLEDARTQRDAYFSDLESRRELDRRFQGRTPEQIIEDLAILEGERDSLTQQLRERPDVRSAERLVGLERERSAWLEERASLQGELAMASGELSSRRLAAIELEALKKQKEALEVHKQLLDGAVNELRSRVDELTRQDDMRNPMMALTSLDETEELQIEARTTTPFGRSTPTLHEFAEDLRHRIATGVDDRTLYYTSRDVRAFLGGLAMTTRLLLLQGISGTGKTSLPLAFANAVGAGIEIVEVQAGWRDRQDLVGYYNAFHRHYYATNFLQALYRAGTPAYRDRMFIMVLDEINLSRPEQFFADFLSALEQPMEKRRLTLLNDPVSNAPRLMIDGRHLPIPPNVWFVGTANHDESTAEFADKTYDRAHIMEMPRKTKEAHFNIQNVGQRNPISYAFLEQAFTDAAQRRNKEVETATNWLRTAKFATSLEKRFNVGWGNRLENQLARYVPVVLETGGSVGEAMDHLLVTKILRKLKNRHDVRATALEELQEQILSSWLDNDNLPERCVALIENEIASKQGEELV